MQGQETDQHRTEYERNREDSLEIGSIGSIRAERESHSAALSSVLPVAVTYSLSISVPDSASVPSERSVCGDEVAVAAPVSKGLDGLHLEPRHDALFIEPSDQVCNNLRMDADKQICGREPDSQFVELAVEVFAMLADATRVRIILALRGGELSVNHLADIVDKSPAAVSQHLAKLRLARIVATRQDAQRVFYRLENEHASQLVSDAIFQAEHSLGNTPRHHHPAGEVTQ
ncbi:DNA-binding transcriptional ArsR family regulator [Mycetocola sp. CAN_C7]